VTLADDQVDVASKPPIEVQGNVEDTASNPPTLVSAKQDRTPVETYESKASSEELSEPAAPAPAAADSKTNEGKKTKDSQLTFKPSARSGRKESGSEKASTEEPVGAVPEKYHPGEPAPIGYWELPDAVRADIPEIKFSVLVYAANSADRFVLINGQRLEEGDTVQPGLEVREIRRDGVIFSYRLYRFLVER
jgi:general secretion pathway protein B